MESSGSNDLVMIIDDSELDRFVTKHAFKKSKKVGNPSIIESNNGQDAIDRLYSMDSTGTAFPRIISLDLNMPVMNGFEFINEFEEKGYAKKYKTIFIFALTSTQDENDIKKIKDNKMITALIEKPISSAKLDELLSDYNL